MGPHGISLILISGQENSGEIAVAASLFIEGTFQYITPVSINHNVRKEFLLSLATFYYREYNTSSSYKEKQLTERLAEPNSSLIERADLLWLALDDQGYTIAQKILTENGISPDTTVYDEIRTLNQIQQAIPPMPKAPLSLEFWSEINFRLHEIASKHRRVRTQRWRRKLFDKHVPISPIEKEYYSWYEALHASLLPWKETIKKMQEDWS